MILASAGAGAALALILGAGAGQAGAPPLDTYAPAARAVIEPAARDAAARPADAGAAARLAMALHAWEQWDHAHAAYARAIAIAPDTFDWIYLDGLVLMRMARPIEAAQRFARARALDPASLAARVKQADALLDAGDTATARDACAELAADPRTEPFGRFGLGRLAAEARRHDEALRELDRALALVPDFGPAHYARARSLRALGRLDEAAQALARHTELGPRWPAVEDPAAARVAALRNDAATLLARARTLAAEGDVAGAIAAHEAVLVRDPSLTQAHANLVSLHGRAGNWAQAETHYRAALAGGIRADVHYDFGVVLMAQSRWAEADAAFREALAVDPHDAAAANNLGQVFERTRRLPEAADAYRRALASRPGLAVARFNLGRMLLALERPAEAVEILEPLAAARGADTPVHLFGLATAYVRIGRRADAIRVGREAVSLARSLGQDRLVETMTRDLARLEGAK
jgi:tetratricopeptide (TPR) repeat protein